MKTKLTSFFIIATMVFSSFAPAFASGRLSRPVIEEIKAGKSSIKIDWGYVEHADAYDIYRATSKNGTFYYLANASESWYRDYSVTKGQRYYYKVRALSYYGSYSDSRLSNWRSAKVKKAKTLTTSSCSTSQTVYITRTGGKYHRYGCRYLRSSCIATSLDSAFSNGYGACSVCW